MQLAELLQRTYIHQKNCYQFIYNKNQFIIKKKNCYTVVQTEANNNWRGGINIVPMNEKDTHTVYARSCGPVEDAAVRA